jgi:HD-GYP domain-containing protein (c-di-GMP phosphodiesterase class II)
VPAGPEISSRSVRAKNVRQAASQILAHVFLGAKVQQLYAGENENVRRAFEALQQKLQDFFSFEREFRLHLEEGYLFVNEIRLRVERATSEAHYWFLERFAASGLQSLTLEPEVNPVELRKLVPVIARATWPEGGAAPALEDELRAAYVVNAKVTLRRAREITRDESGDHVELSSAQLAAALWLRLHRAAAEACEDARRKRALSIRKARSLLQLVVDAFIEDEGALLAMTRLKRYAARGAPERPDAEVYLETHLANTAILAIGIGNRLGLERRQLLDLGTAALFADVGMALVPGELLEGRGALDAEAKAEVARHALASAEMILHADGGARTNYLAAAAAAAHHPDADAPGERPLTASIVAVADAYDAMTTDRPWRPAFPHARAVRILVSGAHGHVPLLAKLLANVLGMYPVGTVVELTTGETGVVAGQDRNPRNAGRPRVKVLIEKNGAPSKGRVVDTSETGRDGKFATQVRRALEVQVGEGKPEDLVAIL